MGLDNHYVANSNNMLIDTSEFKSELNELFERQDSQDLGYAELWSKIHDLIEAKVSTPPDEPSDDQLICRYLSPTKFLWFMSQIEIFFSPASDFDDARDSAIPEDYNKCVKGFLMEEGVTSTIAWDEHIRRMQSRWLVSCWTEISDPDDDHLLWHRYAGGEDGVGITLRYGLLRDLFQRVQKDDPSIEGFFQVTFPTNILLKSHHSTNAEYFGMRKKSGSFCDQPFCLTGELESLISNLKSEFVYPPKHLYPTKMR